ncbi:unnamed protein product, partial [Cyprideis torosa]
QETGNLSESRDRREGGDDSVEHSRDEAGADQQASPSSAHLCVRIGGIQYFAVCGLNRYGRIACIMKPVELLQQGNKRNKRMAKKGSKNKNHPKASTTARTSQARVRDNGGQPGSATREQETGNLSESRDRREGGDDSVEHSRDDSFEHPRDEAGADQQASPSSAHLCVRIGGIQYFAVCGLNRYGRIACIMKPVELLQQGNK